MACIVAAGPRRDRASSTLPPSSVWMRMVAPSRTADPAGRGIERSPRTRRSGPASSCRRSGCRTPSAPCRGRASRGRAPSRRTTCRRLPFSDVPAARSKRRSPATERVERLAAAGRAAPAERRIDHAPDLPGRRIVDREREPLCRPSATPSSSTTAPPACVREHEPLWACTPTSVPATTSFASSVSLSITAATVASSFRPTASQPPPGSLTIPRSKSPLGDRSRGAPCTRSNRTAGRRSRRAAPRCPRR